MTGLTKAQRFVLNWLNEAETSAYGECRGKDLDALMTAGLAGIVRPATDENYSRVAITPAGRHALKEPTNTTVAETCHADRDGDCHSPNCPQLRDGEPARSGRHCSLDIPEADDE